MTARPRVRTLAALLAAAVAIAGSASLASWAGTHAPTPAAAAKPCPRGTARAVIAGKQTCLKAGQRCQRSLDHRYHRYGFHCHTGRLARTKPAPASRPVTLTVAGPPEVVFDWTTDRCEDLDIPDLPARAFRDAEGQVQLISAHYVNRRFVGPDLNRLRHGCDVIMDSDYNADPATFDDQEWIASTWTADGRTIYALVHNEYNGTTHPGQCPSGQYLNCWWNVIALAVSKDGGQTYLDAASPRLIASVPYRYLPDWGTSGAFDPTNIVQRNGFYYTVVRVTLQPRNAPPQYSVNCLIRTQNLADPSSWRAWSGGTSFDTTFVDPYGPNPQPDAHLCKGVSPDQLGEFVPGSLTYIDPAKQWLLVGIRAGGLYYSVSTDLIHWRPSVLFYEATVPWTYTCGGPDPVHYPSLIDPASTSRNFETSGKAAYLYFTQFHTQNCQQGLDRDLVRMPIAIRAP